MENGEDNGEENSQLVSIIESSSPSTHSSDSGSRTIFNLKKRITELESEVTVLRRKLKIVPILFAQEGKDCTEFIETLLLNLEQQRELLEKEQNQRANDAIEFSHYKNEAKAQLTLYETEIDKLFKKGREIENENNWLYDQLDIECPQQRFCAEAEPELAFYKNRCAIYREICQKQDERLKGAAMTFEKLLSLLNASLDADLLEKIRSMNGLIQETRNSFKEAESMAPDYDEYIRRSRTLNSSSSSDRNIACCSTNRNTPDIAFAPSDEPNNNAFAAYPFHGGAEYQQEKLVEKLNQEIREKDNLTSRNQELSEKAQSLEQNCQIAREEITTLQTTIRELQENLHKSRAKAEDLDSQLKAFCEYRSRNKAETLELQKKLDIQEVHIRELQNAKLSLDDHNSDAIRVAFNIQKKFDEENAKHQTQISRLHNILRDEAQKAERLQQLYNAEQEKLAFVSANKDAEIAKSREEISLLSKQIHHFHVEEINGRNYRRLVEHGTRILREKVAEGERAACLTPVVSDPLPPSSARSGTGISDMNYVKFLEHLETGQKRINRIIQYVKKMENNSIACNFATSDDLDQILSDSRALRSMFKRLHDFLKKYPFSINLNRICEELSAIHRVLNSRSGNSSL